MILHTLSILIDSSGLENAFPAATNIKESCMSTKPNDNTSGYTKWL